jgi:hypothetical protein
VRGQQQGHTAALAGICCIGNVEAMLAAARCCNDVQRRAVGCAHITAQPATINARRLWVNIVPSSTAQASGSIAELHRRGFPRGIPALCATRTGSSRTYSLCFQQKHLQDNVIGRPPLLGTHDAFHPPPRSDAAVSVPHSHRGAAGLRHLAGTTHSSVHVHFLRTGCGYSRVTASYHTMVWLQTAYGHSRGIIVRRMASCMA